MKIYFRVSAVVCASVFLLPPGFAASKQVNLIKHGSGQSIKIGDGAVSIPRQGNQIGPKQPILIDHGGIDPNTGTVGGSTPPQKIDDGGIDPNTGTVGGINPPRRIDRGGIVCQNGQCWADDDGPPQTIPSPENPVKCVGIDGAKCGPQGTSPPNPDADAKFCPAVHVGTLLVAEGVSYYTFPNAAKNYGSRAYNFGQSLTADGQYMIQNGLPACGDSANALTGDKAAKARSIEAACVSQINGLASRKAALNGYKCTSSKKVCEKHLNTRRQELATAIDRVKQTCLDQSLMVRIAESKDVISDSFAVKLSYDSYESCYEKVKAMISHYPDALTGGGKGALTPIENVDAFCRGRFPDLGPVPPKPPCDPGRGMQCLPPTSVLETATQGGAYTEF